MIAKTVRPLLAVGLTLALVSCSSSNRSASPSAQPSRSSVGTLRIEGASGTVQLHVQIADTDEARERGLMGVRSLAPDAGMAFLFDGPTDASFWMKDTLLPLSIAFWDTKGRIVGIREMVPCKHDPCALYSPGVPYVGAVEANRGFFAAHGVRLGDRVRLEES
jgi:uncharacterized membrane protein (UPF0127 family)